MTQVQGNGQPHSAPIIEAKGLSKRYQIADGVDAGRKDFWALRDFTTSIYDGERVGIIGRNGAGKSTLLKILSRVIYPSAGQARIRGRVTSLLEVGTGFNNNATGRENIYLNASLHGLSRAEVAERIDDIISFAEIRTFIDEPIKRYSSGMRSRLAFSVAAHLDPDILILDEVLAVGDIAFQQKCLNRMSEVTSRGRTLLFVSHALASITQFCNRCIWLDSGRIAADGDVTDVIEQYVRASSMVSPSFTAPSAAPVRGLSSSGTQKPDAAQEAIDPVCLVSAAVINRHGDIVTTVGVDEEVRIRVVFDVLARDQGVEPALHIKDGEQRVIFVVAFADAPLPSGFNEPGRFTAICRIPPHLLNTGLHHVNVQLVTPTSPVTRHVREDNAISFHVHEASLGQRSARGRYGNWHIPGAVRPMLPWTVESAALPTASVPTDEKRA